MCWLILEYYNSPHGMKQIQKKAHHAQLSDISEDFQPNLSLDLAIPSLFHRSRGRGCVSGILQDE